MKIAGSMDGVIVNADSMQVYDVLRVLTARPSPEDEALAAHRLYGHVPPGESYSTGRWLDDVESVLADDAIAGRPLVFVGGTGLYFRALTQGLSPMPAIPDAVRTGMRARLAEEGAAALHRVLAARDPRAAATLRPGDGQRIVRALEVHEVSGRSILDWQAETGTPLIEADDAERYLVLPERDTLYANIETRFDMMVEAGALDEARALLALDLDPSLPAMKAIGVREFADALAGRCAMDEAVARAKTATRQYAKRQMTWFRNQLGEGWRRVERP
ncbi:tRNA (adenosine(37)-N6)-dimethylallyltransferase MiaA [Oricola sp.]|uniref:tRNA (adenosine(37)-N6)-dimethylallyltransferase MiaA n=1 Tax=Oricola sp. TaxID=1979950 RepID=UPI0025F9928F|nr:tRNA (adenosine(37)-N6)-dimethylallyltransferase MiaA [Oricola sp.]MCI5075703.1 tRNA (adenosine(37)-N6)-dimethylallyltransferase MiaA [Oricola sp.]